MLRAFNCTPILLILQFGWIAESLPLPQQLVLYSAAGKPLQSITLQKRRGDISALAAGVTGRTEDGVGFAFGGGEMSLQATCDQ